MLSDVHLDRLILHDQPVPGGHRHPVLGDQAAGAPADAGAEGPVLVLLHPGQHGRAWRLLRGDLPAGLSRPPQGKEEVSGALLHTAGQAAAGWMEQE